MNHDKTLKLTQAATKYGAKKRFNWCFLVAILWLVPGCSQLIDIDKRPVFEESTVSHEKQADGSFLTSNFGHFITRDKHRLMDGDNEFRFAGIHAPELHRVENDAVGPCIKDGKHLGSHFRWPTADEQSNWIKAHVRSGAKAMRIYVLSIETERDQLCNRETHIHKPTVDGGMPVLNEEAFLHYDRMIALADKHGLRLILPFVDHWKWWGGRKDLAAFYGEGEDALYDTNSKTFAAYLNIIEQVVSRKNTYTGRLYSQEKAILAWETGNELQLSTSEFVAKTAAHIKNLAPQQLVVDGKYVDLLASSLEDPNVDIISNHYYSNVGNNNPETVVKDLTFIGGKKVYIVGEFGLRPIEDLTAIMNAIVDSDVDGAKAAGGLVWGFRGHRHNGGFYWHPEGDSGYYSYHLPGFPEGESNQEQSVVDMVRNAQARMMGLKKAPPLPIPEAPILRPITDASNIRWMGAPVGRYYRIERAESNNGPWKTIAEGISDGANKFHPVDGRLFGDKQLESNKTYFYRVYASNESGESKASNIESYANITSK